jgi:basic membrane protein A
MDAHEFPNLTRFGIATVVATAALALGACGSSKSSSSTTAAAGSSSATTSAPAGSSSGVPIGVAQPDPTNDHSFGEATHNGALKAVAQLKIKLNEVDSLVTPQQQTTALENLARTNKLVLMDGAITAAGVYKKFPNTQFVITDGALPPAPNNHSVIQDWIPVGYLAGIAAAHTSKTHTIGFVGGIPIPVIAAALKGYTAGAKSVDPSIKVLSTDIGSFTDSVKGKEAAAAQVASGADVIYADLDTAHTGVVQAAQAGKSVKVIGSVAPKCDISSGLDIGDTVFDESHIVFTTIADFVKDGKLPPTLAFGLQGGYSSFNLCPGAPASLTGAIKKATSGLLSGSIKP